MSAPPVGEHCRERVRRLQERYIDALDAKDMQGWLACFADDGAYYVIGADNEAAGLPLCLMMDDCRERLVDRVTFVTDVWRGSYEDYQTRHFIQPLDLAPADDGLLAARTNVGVLATDLKGQTSIFVAGQYRDLIRADANEALLKERRLVLDTFTTPGVIVYPL